jgi:sulfatase maturation enzyme AslB (radical SAM superfamily)
MGQKKLVTQRCNLRCKYCINGEMYGNDENNYTKNLSFEKAKSVIDFLFRQFQEGDSVPQIALRKYFVYWMNSVRILIRK